MRARVHACRDYDISPLFSPFSPFVDLAGFFRGEFPGNRSKKLPEYSPFADNCMHDFHACNLCAGICRPCMHGTFMWTGEFPGEKLPALDVCDIVAMEVHACSTASRTSCAFRSSRRWTPCSGRARGASHEWVRVPHREPCHIPLSGHTPFTAWRLRLTVLPVTTGFSQTDALVRIDWSRLRTQRTPPRNNPQEGFFVDTIRLTKYDNIHEFVPCQRDGIAHDIAQKLWWCLNFPAMVRKFAVIARDATSHRYRDFRCNSGARCDV